jgi:hypothetical protein
MSITFRKPETPTERALVQAFETETEILHALCSPIALQFLEATGMDNERIKKTQRRELYASRVRYAALKTQIMYVLPVAE